MWLTLVIPVLTLGRLRQEDCSEFKTSLGYRVILKNTTKTKHQKANNQPAFRNTEIITACCVPLIIFTIVYGPGPVSGR